MNREVSSNPPADGDAKQTAVRKVIHVDMDAFYASVEQRDNPDLRGKPIAVGGSARRGVVAAASYEAREYGVRSAMPSSRAKKLCPDLIFVRARFDAYRAVSRQIREIFARHTDLIQPLSLDEAYLDVTQDKQGIGSAVKVAKAIRGAIQKETGLTASAGVSYNKFIAKLASDQNKPDGLCVILPDQGPEFVAGLPVRRFHGVGPRTAEKMARLNIHTGADLRAQSEDWLNAHFGSFGGYLYRAARGIDNRAVNPDGKRKSVGGERTYGEDKVAEADIRAALDDIIDIVWKRIEKSEVAGRTVILKARHPDFTTMTRSHSRPGPVSDRQEFAQIGHQLMDQLLPSPVGFRLLGITLAGLIDGEENEMQDMQQQLALFDVEN